MHIVKPSLTSPTKLFENIGKPRKENELFQFLFIIPENFFSRAMFQDGIELLHLCKNASIPSLISLLISLLRPTLASIPSQHLEKLSSSFKGHPIQPSYSQQLFSIFICNLGHPDGSKSSVNKLDPHQNTLQPEAQLQGFFRIAF